MQRSDLKVECKGVGAKVDRHRLATTATYKSDLITEPDFAVDGTQCAINSDIGCSVLRQCFYGCMLKCSYRRVGPVGSILLAYIPMYIPMHVWVWPNVWSNRYLYMPMVG